ncbi:signal peptidase (SPase) II [Oxobacter pfennigii]|uniref:Signal peptidase (SPase) II n=1 Tax=Oxobacter pfennigii TaxID=36849 RepID=A0A0P9ABK7_9CLOT|nr:signal peptidase II [Oxobacter pfennigii]KPU42455.1 signal peptidase (SPase) II [Oxobacter pfennigii]
MKKPFVFSLVLIVIDQAIKLFIAHYYINADAVLLPGILFFRPVQNINLTWIASIIDYKTPALLMIVIQIFSLAIITFSYRYLSYLWNQGKKLLNGMLIFFIAGIMCSFIDVAFWGGSLDFLRLFDLFTFDFKDVYLNIASGFVLFYTGNYLIKAYSKMSKAERKQTGLCLWIKNGMPSSPIG